MRLQKFLCVLALMLPTAGFAGACGPDRDSDIPILEDAKTAFLEGNYERIAQIAGPMFPDLADNYKGLFGQLEQVFPRGYTRCLTVLQRREAPGFYQDLMLYFPVGFDGPIALHLIATDVDDAPALLEITFNSSVSDVLDGLK